MAKDFLKLSEAEKNELLDEVFETAKRYESTYGCCAQCVLGAMYDVLGIGDKAVFQAAYGFGGGTGLTSQNSCGALAGAVMLIGIRCGRTYEDFDKGRAEKCYDLSKRALEYFEQKYGGPLCKDVQTCIMGRSFDMNIPEENDAFVEAGGHVDKCTNVCGDTCQYLAKMIMSGEL